MIYFISGHRNIGQVEFEEHYVPALQRVLEDKESSVVVGDYLGVDLMAQAWLRNHGYEKVTVYHMFTKARNNVGFPTIGGFTSDEHRDSTMTLVSDADIAWVRPGKEDSGTALNLKRRSKCKVD